MIELKQYTKSQLHNLRHHIIESNCVNCVCSDWTEYRHFDTYVAAVVAVSKPEYTHVALEILASESAIYEEAHRIARGVLAGYRAAIVGHCGCVLLIIPSPGHFASRASQEKILEEWETIEEAAKAELGYS